MGEELSGIEGGKIGAVGMKGRFGREGWDRCMLAMRESVVCYIRISSAFIVFVCKREQRALLPGGLALGAEPRSGYERRGEEGILQRNVALLKS